MSSEWYSCVCGWRSVRWCRDEDASFSSGATCSHALTSVSVFRDEDVIVAATDDSSDGGREPTISSRRFLFLLGEKCTPHSRKINGDFIFDFSLKRRKLNKIEGSKQLRAGSRAVEQCVEQPLRRLSARPTPTHTRLLLILLLLLHHHHCRRCARRSRATAMLSPRLYIPP